MEKLNKGLATYLSQESLDKIAKIKIGIAGCGGIGSNVAMNLVRSGFKNFVLVDFDHVEESNLNRQFFFADQVGVVKVDALEANLKRIAKDLNIEVHSLRVAINNANELFSDCDIIVEAFDCPQSKAMLISSILPTADFLVACNGMAGIGQADDIVTTKKSDKFVIVGDNKTEVSATVPPISPRVNVCAAKMADVILDKVLNET